MHLPSIATRLSRWMLAHQDKVSERRFPLSRRCCTGQSRETISCMLHQARFAPRSTQTSVSLGVTRTPRQVPAAGNSQSYEYCKGHNYQWCLAASIRTGIGKQSSIQREEGGGTKCRARASAFSPQPKRLRSSAKAKEMDEIAPAPRARSSCLSALSPIMRTGCNCASQRTVPAVASNISAH
jgi:hypothetical protein